MKRLRREFPDLATVIAAVSSFAIRLVVVLAFAATIGPVAPTPAHAEKRVALVIGNGAYRHAPHLPNPAHDAEDVAASLKRVGFDVILETDLDQAAMQNAQIRFAREARTADVALFYYSGHALQYGGVNYLVPIDADLHDETDLRRMARADEVLADLQHARNLRILVLDSCRDNPLADELKRSIGTSRGATLAQGLAKMDSPEGTIISYSTQAGRTATDGTGRNSPYTSAFLRHIEDKDNIATVFHNISANVYEASNRAQLPELSLSFFGEFYLNGKLQITVSPAVSPAAAPADPCAAAETHWKSAEAIGGIAAFEDHLARFPACAYSTLARARLEQLKRTAERSPDASVPAPSVPPRTSGYSDWLPGAEYQKLFDAMLQLRRYPRTVEAQASNGALVFRAAFEPYPEGTFGFYSRHGISPDAFAREDRLRRDEGYRLVHRQSVRFNGAEFIQATWVRP